MLRDRLDQLLCACLVLTLVVLTGLLLTSRSTDSNASMRGPDRQLEREIAQQARQAYLERRYQPVVEQVNRGAYPEALLTLEELSRDLPGEVHSDLLRGDILFRVGQVDRAISSLALAVRHNGDYVDQASPLQRRVLIEAVVTQGVPLVRDRLRAQPDNRSLEGVLKDGYDLQSRLAGGCQ